MVAADDPPFLFIDGTPQAAAGASYAVTWPTGMQATLPALQMPGEPSGLIKLESQWGTSDGIYHRELKTGGPV